VIFFFSGTEDNRRREQFPMKDMDFNVLFSANP